MSMRNLYESKDSCCILLRTVLQYFRIIQELRRWASRLLLGENMISDTFRVCYDKLWAMLTERKMKKKDLQSVTHLSSAVIAKLGNLSERVL